MENKQEKVNERILIKVLQDVSDDEYYKWERANGTFDDLISLINNKDQRIWSEFFLKVCKMYDEAIEVHNKKSYNPDYEYLLKHPDTEIYKSMD